jgi:hypothetical protein
MDGIGSSQSPENRNLFDGEVSYDTMEFPAPQSNETSMFIIHPKTF